MDNLKKIDTLSKQHSFKQIFLEVLSLKGFSPKDVQILDITVISQTEYFFIIYQRILKLRFKVQASYNPKTSVVTIKNIEEVYSTKLQDLKLPQPMETKLITK